MKQQRKRIWIDPFQTKLFVRIIILCLIYQVALWILLIGTQQVVVCLETLLQQPLPGGRWVLTGAVLLLLAPLLIMDVVRFTHRLVGPLYRFRKIVQALADGEPVPRVRLRRGDFLHDFKDDFNRMLTTLEEKGLVVIADAAKDDTAKQPQPV
jgi:hypothetical protein